jgi:hypothetical protein
MKITFYYLGKRPGLSPKKKKKKNLRQFCGISADSHLRSAKSIQNLS